MIECIPNISEGKDLTVIQRIRSAIEEISGVHFLHHDVSPDAHRSVLTFAGDPEPLAEAVLKMYELALELIDMRKHAGVHPRIGAVDVCPFVPLTGRSAEEAQALAKQLGAEISKRFSIPVFLYEQSAAADYRRRLYDIRRGQFEGLAEKFKDPLWGPDFGPAHAHETFGATVLGARDFLVAFNVSLKTEDVTIARTIAAALRSKRHSTDPVEAAKWSALRAIGWHMRSYQCVQVSTNIVDTQLLGPLEVFQMIQQMAAEQGVEVLGSEMIGLIPEKVLVRSAGKDPATIVANLGLEAHRPFDLDERVLEYAIRKKLGRQRS